MSDEHTVPSVPASVPSPRVNADAAPATSTPTSASGAESQAERTNTPHPRASRRRPSGSRAAQPGVASNTENTANPSAESKAESNAETAAEHTARAHRRRRPRRPSMPSTPSAQDASDASSVAPKSADAPSAAAPSSAVAETPKAQPRRRRPQGGNPSAERRAASADKSDTSSSAEGMTSTATSTTGKTPTTTGDEKTSGARRRSGSRRRRPGRTDAQGSAASADRAASSRTSGAKSAAKPADRNKKKKSKKSSKLSPKTLVKKVWSMFSKLAIWRTKGRYRRDISKEEINALPTERLSLPIHVIDTEDALAAVLPTLMRAPLLGFDTETRPSFSHAERPHLVSLLQLSTPDACYLIRLNKVGMPQSLCSLLSSPSPLKIGLSVHDDIRSLSRRRSFAPAGFVDLQDLAPELRIDARSLQKLYAIFYKRKISKAQRLSNWEDETLTEAQRHYAALDAYACLRMYTEIFRPVRTEGER